jgi:hypothetical protein
MALPATIRVKLSSEEAGAISITAVVSQEIPLKDLVELMLGLAGKDEARLLELLRRGALVSGASRYRWSPFETAPGELLSLLAAFPDPDPSRPFSPGRCRRVTLRSPGRALELPHEAAAAKALLRRQTYWDALMEVCAAGELVYAGYSYRERADRYTRLFTPAEVERLKEAATLLKYSTLRDRLRALPFTSAELAAAR